MKTITYLTMILLIVANFKLYSQNVKSVNLCFENDWKTNYPLEMINDSIFTIQIEIQKYFDANMDNKVSTQFYLIYDKGFERIGGSFPTDTTGQKLSSMINVPLGNYSVSFNLKTLNYYFTDIEHDFYRFTNSELDSNQYIYCEIVGYRKLLSNKVTIEIDFGQYRPRGKDNRLTDNQTGERINFNSMIDALNFMGKFGWEFVQAYAITMGSQNVYHFLMKKYNK
jgi:hypothetical protein